MTRGARRAFAILALAGLVASGASTAASVLYATVTAHRQDAQQRAQDATIARLDAATAQLRRQQLASCAGAADLGSIPLADKPPPSRFVIRLLTDNRGQWHELGCPGALPVPPGLAKWAAHYGIPVNGKGS
jgi:hypothetical protein